VQQESLHVQLEQLVVAAALGAAAAAAVLLAAADVRHVAVWVQGVFLSRTAAVTA
jgi:hypothetical protein